MREGSDAEPGMTTETMQMTNCYINNALIIWHLNVRNLFFPSPRYPSRQAKSKIIPVYPNLDSQLICE